MIEVIALIFLCRMNGNLAIQKGLKASTWKWYTVLAWIVAEIIGMILAIAMFGNNLAPIMMIALVSAFGGYLFIKYKLEKMPDSMEDDIDSIGIDDLQPPRR